MMVEETTEHTQNRYKDIHEALPSSDAENGKLILIMVTRSCIPNTPKEIMSFLLFPFLGIVLPFGIKKISFYSKGSQDGKWSPCSHKYVVRDPPGKPKTQCRI